MSEYFHKLSMVIQIFIVFIIPACILSGICIVITSYNLLWGREGMLNTLEDEIFNRYEDNTVVYLKELAEREAVGILVKVDRFKFIDHIYVDALHDHLFNDNSAWHWIEDIPPQKLEQVAKYGSTPQTFESHTAFSKNDRREEDDALLTQLAKATDVLEQFYSPYADYRFYVGIDDNEIILQFPGEGKRYDQQYTPLARHWYHKAKSIGAEYILTEAY
jgi:hypothetical protein